MGKTSVGPEIAQTNDWVSHEATEAGMPQKGQALAEIWRILRPGGYLALADLIVVGEMEPITTEGFEDAWSWCVAGALSAGEYDVLLKSKGFSWWELKEKGNYGPLAAAHLLVRKGGKD